MSDEMAVSDNVAGDEDKLKSGDAPEGAGEDVQDAPAAQPEELAPAPEEEPTIAEDPPEDDPPPEYEEDIPEEPIEDFDINEKDDFLDADDKTDADDKKDADDKNDALDNPVVPTEAMDTDDKGAEAEVKEVEEVVPQAALAAKDGDKRGVKRKASDAFSEVPDDEFKGFDSVDIESKTEVYSRVVERLEAEVVAAKKNFIPLRHIMGTPTVPARASKRPRKDTEGSRPSSAMSSRSDEATDATVASGVSSASSPLGRGRRSTTEMSSPLLRAPLERGWKRELVYRAALDAHSRRNADIYYYTPKGKKLRSTREVAEHLSGTGLTLENFSFFKEPLGVDDPEKEIIRDAKLIRRVESPVSSPAPVTQVEGKRTPKPKPPKGVSPEPTPKSPPAKIKQVKSVGSRLGGAPAPSPAAPAPPAPKSGRRPAADNNNTAAWKKPRAPAPEPPAPATPAPPAPPAHPPPATPAPPAPPPTPAPPQLAHAQQQPPHPPQHPPEPRPQLPHAQQQLSHVAQQLLPHAPRPQTPPVQPQPVQTRPSLVQTSPDVPGGVSSGVSSGAVLQPCSMSCGRGAVPSLSCAACLCLYHPACVGLRHAHAGTFLCKNCRKSSSPPLLEPAAHKGAPPRRAAPAPPRPQRRVLLRMKAAGSVEGERVWSVAPPAPPPTAPAPTVMPTPTPAPPHHVPPHHVPPHHALPHHAPPHHAPPHHAPPPSLPPPTWRGAAPQSLAVLNGRRFVVVPRSLVQAATHTEERRRGRLANGAASPPSLTSPLASLAGGVGAAVAGVLGVPGEPRRRGRPRADDVDHFTAFYHRARDTNVVVQIFQYLGMRDLAHSARVCKLWRQLAATPALWRHVRMKNSHVSDWGGLCTALKRHGTKRLDLRKMLLPQNDSLFWEQFAQHIGTVDTLERIEMCRCPAAAVEAVCGALPGLRSLAALAIRDARLDPAPLARLPLLHELRLKSLAGLSLTRDLTDLAALTRLQHLSLTSIKELGWCACEVVGSLPLLESLELGECTFRAEFGAALARLARLRRLRLERGPAAPAAPPLLRALARLPRLASLELVNVDVKVGFDDALAECTNIQRLLIIPTYVSQSATTNKQVLGGVLRLKDTLTHLMWGVTIELLRVTELFIDQCEQAGDAKKRDVGECIPVLKPVPGCKLPSEHQHVAGPPQVEILPLPTLQRLLSAQLPNTKLKLLRIPFHATWRQSLADFQ